MFGSDKNKKAVQVPEFLDSEKIYERGVATIRDLIAPAAMRISTNYIQIGETYARTLFIIAYPRYLHTNWFSPIINMDFPMNISMFVHPVDTAEILKTLRKTTTQVQSQIHIEEEGGKVRDPILETALQDIEDLRDKLQQGTEKFFRFGIYMTVYAKTIEDLDKVSQEIEAILGCTFIQL